MSIQKLIARHEIETAIERQEASRAAAAERALETQIDDTAAREFANALALAERAHEASVVTGHGAITAAHGANAPQEAGRVAPPAPEGDAILDGITLLRTNFDRHIQQIGATIRDDSLTGTEAMFKVQTGLIAFGLLTDTSSKIAGKMVQTGDTLLKA